MNRWSGIDVPTSLYLCLLGSDALYRFDGQRESIRRIISAAKSMLSRNAISRAGDGFPSSADSFLHAKIAAITPRVRLRPSSISLSIGVLRKDLRQRRGTTVYYSFFHMSQNNMTAPARVRRDAFDVLEKKPLLDDFCHECFSLVKMSYEAPAFSKS